MQPLSEDDLHALYLWVDDIPLSRPKRNISRDFADGVCVAEIVKFYFPRLVELHNYAGSSSAKQKKDNWDTLNAKVFRRLHFEVPDEEVRDIMNAVPGAIEKFLKALQTKIVQVKQKQESGDFPAAPRPVAARPVSAARGDEKDRTIMELRESMSLLTEKISHLENLLQVKDGKIAELERRLRSR
jgi:hypothetical protein